MFQYVDALRLLMAWCELRWGFDHPGFNEIFGVFKEEEACSAKSRMPTPHLAAGN